MKYRNTNTGAVIDISSGISAGPWEPLGAPKQPVSEAKIPSKAEESIAPKKTGKKAK